MEPLKEQIAKLQEKTQVTSEKGRTNLKDHIVAWGGSLLAAIWFTVTSAYSIASQLLASIADYVLPYLQRVSQQDRPAWLAVATFLVMGLVILNKRRLSGGNYTPPPPLPPPPPVYPLPPHLATPAAPQTVVGQTPPPPPGTPVDTSKTAF